MSTTLSISHNLFLTKEQRYAWYSGEDIEVIGVSVPVWVAKGNSSEPAVEVFAKYRLFNRNDRIYIKHYEEGYEVTVPQKPAEEATPPPDDIWHALNADQQAQWYQENEPTPSIRNLLDVRDGGSGWLAFRQYSKIHKGKKLLHVIHFMEMKDVEELAQTLT